MFQRPVSRRRYIFDGHELRCYYWEVAGQYVETFNNNTMLTPSSLGSTIKSEFRVAINGLGVGSPGTLLVTLVYKIGPLSFNEELFEKKLAEFVKV